MSQLLNGHTWILRCSMHSLLAGKLCTSAASIPYVSPLFLPKASIIGKVTKRESICLFVLLSYYPFPPF